MNFGPIKTYSEIIKESGTVLEKAWLAACDEQSRFMPNSALWNYYKGKADTYSELIKQEKAAHDNQAIQGQ